MEDMKNMSFREMMQLRQDLEELQQTHDMIQALSHFDVKEIKTIKKV